MPVWQSVSQSVSVSTLFLFFCFREALGEIDHGWFQPSTSHQSITLSGHMTHSLSLFFRLWSTTTITTIHRALSNNRNVVHGVPRSIPGPVPWYRGPLECSGPRGILGVPHNLRGISGPPWYRVSGSRGICGLPLNLQGPAVSFARTAVVLGILYTHYFIFLL